MKVLITGARGFVGSYLTDFLLSKKGIEVHGLGRNGSKESVFNSASRKTVFHSCDIRDLKAVTGVLKKAKPDRVFHLAAQSFVPSSWASPKETLSVNVIGQLNLFEALNLTGGAPKVHIAGSSEAYGRVLPKEIPVREANTLRPLNPYGVSKAAQDLLAYQHGRNSKLQVVRTRAFNHTGPGQPDRFVASDFARQVALIEAGKRAPVIHVGNLESIRDFTDVRDIVKAYWLALEKGKAGEVYNVCSGKGHKIREIVEIYLKHSKIRIKIKQDKTRMRPSDVPVLVGSAEKFKKQTGWKPEIPFKTTLLDILNYWRQNIEL